jgi:hypothetical protein
MTSGKEQVLPACSAKLSRCAKADARGAARFFLQVFDRGAQVVAAAPRRCRSKRRKNLLMFSGNKYILPVCGVELSGRA